MLNINIQYFGGRGSGGGSRSGRGGGFSLPEITGSDRQVQWAKDILRTPYENLGNAANSHDNIANQLGSNGSDQRNRANAYRAAQQRYANQVRELGGGNPVSASQIIDRRTGFSRVAQNIAMDEFRKRGLNQIEVSI